MIFRFIKRSYTRFEPKPVEYLKVMGTLIIDYQALLVLGVIAEVHNV